MKKIVLASSNAHKLKEFQEILSDYEILSLKDVGFNGDIVEDGKTFYDNSLIKAKTVYQKVNMPCIADDSGLCVNALKGEPGVFSARYSGTGDDNKNIDKLLLNLKNKDDRSAKFVSCVVYYDGIKIIFAEGYSSGKILKKRSGKNGFGYDSVFHSSILKKSFGKCSSEEKNSVSHRAEAIKKLLIKFKESNI